MEPSRTSTISFLSTLTSEASMKVHAQEEHNILVE